MEWGPARAGLDGCRYPLPSELYEEGLLDVKSDDGRLLLGGAAGGGSVWLEAARSAPKRFELSSRSNGRAGDSAATAGGGGGGGDRCCVASFGACAGDGEGGAERVLGGPLGTGSESWCTPPYIISS